MMASAGPWACVADPPDTPGADGGISDATSEPAPAIEGGSLLQDAAIDAPEPESLGDAADASRVTDAGAVIDAAATIDAAVEAAGPDPTLAFCDALRAHTASCAEDAATAAMNSACYAQDIANCGAISFILSDAARQGYGSCGSALGCSPGSAFLDDPCVSNQVAHAALTPTQSRVAEDYCAACPEDPGPTCVTDFYRLAADGSTGAGFELRKLNDTIVQAVRNLCLPIPGDQDAGTCANRFDYCALIRIEQRIPQYSCDGG
jgi:hypothetical protein